MHNLNIAFVAVKWLIPFIFLVGFSECNARNITIIGGNDCVKWALAKKSEEKVPKDNLDWIGRATAKSWVYGYVSGYNAGLPSKSNFLDSIDAETIVNWVDQYCEKYPTQNVTDSIDKLFVKLMKNKR
jgi:hypothetical protein